ncbi:MAG TPA: hypothetical protein VF066_12805 [Thermoleophilaceae bacterium]
MRKARLVTFGAILAVAVGAAIAVAQQPVPTVAVSASPTAVEVQAPAALAAGPTRLDITRQGNKDVSLYFALLNQGVSLQELQTAIARDGRNGESALGLVWIQASASLTASEPRRAVTFNLRPGLTYVVLAEEDTDSGTPQRSVTTFATSGQANGATAPAPAATVRMQGLRFRGSAVLPRQGVVRMENRDGVPHFAIAFPLRKSATTKRLGRALRSNNERALGRLVAGQPYRLQNLISGGNTANDQEVRFPRTGRYALMCFFHAHHTLGMYRVVTVR